MTVSSLYQKGRSYRLIQLFNILQKGNRKVHFNFKGYLILIALILLILVYEILIPYIRHTRLHWDTKELYGQLSGSVLPWQVIGKSTEGRDIYALELQSGQDTTTTVIFGAFHGDEQTGFHLVVQLAETLYAKPNLIHSRVVLIPVLNPDGLLKRKRTNANDVDINRNFPTDNWTPVYEKARYHPGPSPGSEVETQLAMKIIDRYHPAKIISIHDDLMMNNYNGPAKELAEEMAKYNGYPVTSDVGYPTPGSFGNFAGEELGIPLITLELPDTNPEDAWEENGQALIAAINFKR